MFLRSSSAGTLVLVGFAVGGLLESYLALSGGVHAPTEMVDAPVERLALVAEPGMILFGEGPSGRAFGNGRYFLERNLIALPLGEACLLVFL